MGVLWAPRILWDTAAYLILAAGDVRGRAEIEILSTAPLCGMVRYTLTAPRPVRLRGPSISMLVDGAPPPEDLAVDVVPTGPGAAFFRIRPGPITTALGLPLLAPGRRRLSVLLASDPCWWASRGGEEVACLRFESPGVPLDAEEAGDVEEALRRANAARLGEYALACARRGFPVGGLEGFVRPGATTDLKHGQPILVALRPGEAWPVRCGPPAGDPVRGCALLLGGDGVTLVEGREGRLTAPGKAGVYRVGCFVHRAAVAWVRVGE